MSQLQFRNCLVFAWTMSRYGRKGDHLLIRKSEHSWFPHFKSVFELQDGSVVIYEYVPLKPIDGKWFPPIFFHGKTIKKTYELVDTEEWPHWNTDIDLELGEEKC